MTNTRETNTSVPVRAEELNNRGTMNSRGTMCLGKSDLNLSPTKWPLKQGQAMNFFNFYELSEKISDFQSSFAVFTIFFFKTE